MTKDELRVGGSSLHLYIDINMFSSPSKASKRVDICSAALGSPVLNDVFSPRVGAKRGAGETPVRTPPRPFPATLNGIEDRFIPNRAKLDEEMSHYLVTNEEVPASATGLRSPIVKTPGQQKLKQELSLLSPTEGKRIMDCRKSLMSPMERTSSSSGFFSVSPIVYYPVKSSF